MPERSMMSVSPRRRSSTGFWILSKNKFMDVKEFENKRWTRGEQKIFFRHRAAVDLVERSQKVLDLGCGDGLLLSLLRDKKGTAGTGLDLSDKGVEMARAKGLDAHVFDFGR